MGEVIPKDSSSLHGTTNLSSEAASSYVESTVDLEAITSLSAKDAALNPTPSPDPEDPLNWPLWVKIGVLTQTSLLAAIGGLNTAMINPAMVSLAKEFNIGKIEASYQTTVCIALNGIAPWIWIPLAHRYGRRPVWLATTFLAFLSILGCAFAKSYTQLLVARIFNGLFPVGFALGATSVVDMFFFHQRGRAMGFFTVTVVNGSHLAPIIGGLLGQYCGWRWIFKFLAIVDAVLFIIAIFCLPETMYLPRMPETRTRASTRRHHPNAKPATPASQSVIRNINLGSDDRSSTPVKTSIGATFASTSSIPSPNLTPTASESHLVPPTAFQRYRYHLRLFSFNSAYEISWRTSLLPTLRLFFSPTAVFPAIYYASMYGFASILPAVTVAAIFSEFFGWNTLTIGLTYGAALTIGGVLGEAASGWVCDAVVKREQKRLQRSGNATGGIRPEVRLRPIWTGVILTPIGMLVYGFTLQYHLHPALPLFGMGLSCFGLQIITTCTYTYSIDCHTVSPSSSVVYNHNSSSTQRRHRYQPRSSTINNNTNSRDDDIQGSKAGAAEVAQLFNFIRQTFGFTFAFYVIRMGRTIGYQFTFVIFAFCGGVLAFLPVLGLMFFPDKIFGLKREEEQENLDSSTT